METVIEFLKAILIGIVQGITEWLPISSTGHMILLNDLVHLNVSDAFWEMFEVVIQLGSILAVGCIVAFVVSLAAIRFLMDFVKKHSFTAFGIYRIVLGVIVLLWQGFVK